LGTWGGVAGRVRKQQQAALQLPSAAATTMQAKVCGLDRVYI
jgi:hypothetical protein